MNQDLLLSKVVANATDTAWSQAYSTLKFYIVLSLKSDSVEKSIAALGKEVLEKIQREFFALDEKNLSTIKGAVENVTKNLDDVEYSILLATIINGSLYLIAGGEAQALLKRQDKVGTVAKGEKGKVTAFSGKVQGDDILALETSDFSQKISGDIMKEALSLGEVVSIAESLAPRIHEGGLGTEAALILQYKDTSAKEDLAAISNETFDQDLDKTGEAVEEREEEEVEGVKAEAIEEKEEETPIKEAENSLESEEITPEQIETPQEEDTSIETLGDPEASIYNSQEKKSRKKLPSISVPRPRLSKKYLLLGAILVLVAVLGFGILTETKRRTENTRNEKLSTILTPAQKAHDDGKALASLNASLALEEFVKAKDILEKEKDTFPDGSEQDEKVESLLSAVNEGISSLENASNVSGQKVLFDAANSDEFPTLSSVTLKGGDVVIAGGSNAAVIGSDGKVESAFDTDATTITTVSANENTVFAVASNGIFSIPKNGDDPEQIVEDPDFSPVGIETFGSNIYVLDKSDNAVLKFASPSYSQSNYFTQDVDFGGDVTSFSIDSSIWVTDGEGGIHKFTRGAKDSFSIRGLTRQIGPNPLIYTDEEYANIYVSDRANRRIVSVAKSGEYKTQYDWGDLSKASSFAIDEPGKKAYIVVGTKLHTFDL